jgi:hypothetical protein
MTARARCLQVGKVFAVLEAVWPPTARITERWDFKGHRGPSRKVPQVMRSAAMRSSSATR